MGLSAVLSVLALARAPALADGIVLEVQPGPGLDGVTLNWTGGLPAYTVCRSTSPMAVARSSNVLGQTGSMTWPDLPPQGDIFYYEVTGIGCADGSAEQVFSLTMHGCVGNVNFESRSALCAPGWHPCAAAEWVGQRTSAAPTYNYWTDETLAYSGAGPNFCAVAPSGTFGYTSCIPAPSTMIVCTPTGLDPLGNRCAWYQCGYKMNSPGEYFGGCASAAGGTLCCDP